jgi:hypothetical protein
VPFTIPGLLPVAFSCAPAVYLGSDQ